MPNQDGEITSIPDIGAIMEEGCAVAGGRYMGISVLLLDMYSSYCICKSKVQVMSATLGQCDTPTLEQGSNPSLNLAGG